MKISLPEINVIEAEMAKLEPPLEAVRKCPSKKSLTMAPELQKMLGRGFTTVGLLEALKKNRYEPLALCLQDQC